MDYVLQSMDYTLQSMDYTLQSMDCILQSMDCALQSMQFYYYTTLSIAIPSEFLPTVDVPLLPVASMETG